MRRPVAGCHAVPAGGGVSDMGKVNQQLPFMCGKCKKFFHTERAVTDHARATPSGLKVVLYRQFTHIDMRDEREPSMADRQIAAMQAVACGEPTDDAWLIP